MINCWVCGSSSSVAVESSSCFEIGKFCMVLSNLTVAFTVCKMVCSDMRHGLVLKCFFHEKFGSLSRRLGSISYSVDK